MIGAMADDEEPHARFPAGFFSRADERPDDEFYGPDRFVTHIDAGAIDAVGRLYRGLELDGRVLDLMSSWVSHFLDRPHHLTVLGMNERELRANTMADEVVVHDLNTDARLPFPDDAFDAATCCVSIDYLVRPIDVLRDAARVVRAFGLVVCTFSDRCFPTKAVRGWLGLTDAQRCDLVAAYFQLAGGYSEVKIATCVAPGGGGDPLYAVWGVVHAS